MHPHILIVLLITLACFSVVIAPVAQGQRGRGDPQRSNALAVFKGPPQPQAQPNRNVNRQRQKDAPLARKGTNRPRNGGASEELPRKGPVPAPRPTVRPAPRGAATPKKAVPNALAPRPTPKRPMTKAVTVAKPKPVQDLFKVPQELRKHQKITCTPGRAIYDLYWTEPFVGYRKYHVSCKNFTQSCREKCEYSTNCTQQKYGPNLYVRGIQLVYDGYRNIQHYFLFLCCNTTLVPENRRCEGRRRLKESTRLSGAVVAMTQLTFREADSTYPDDKTRKRIVKSGQTISFEACTNLQQKKANILCPYVQATQGQSGGSSDPPLDPLLATGITSLVLGTVFWGIRIGPAPPKCSCGNCCCRKNQICSGIGFSGDGNLGNFFGISLQECLARCLSDVRCVAMEHTALYGQGCDIETLRICNPSLNIQCRWVQITSIATNAEFVKYVA